MFSSNYDLTRKSLKGEREGEKERGREEKEMKMVEKEKIKKSQLQNGYS